MLGAVCLGSTGPNNNGADAELDLPTSFWFIAERNTVTDEVIRTYPASELFAERVEFADAAKPDPR